MADVIFNGSASRRAVNAAEVTLTFDNSDQLLDIETPEVHITRRVYRSGEGEYLINRAPARLRDIRDLLSGTGLGTQAYSVIEQGKVDVLLQASPRDRRLIFEEAAGISRFKARKIESLRRLERVEQNLLRLSDIVDEVESRLRSVRLQAGKARRYKEYTDRLQELRTQVGLVDWQRLSEKLGGLESELRLLTDQRDTAAARTEAVEAQVLGIDTGIGDVGESIRSSEARIAANRERIASVESAIGHERLRTRDLEQEIARHRRSLSAMNARAGDLKQQLHETGQSVESAEEQHRQIRLRLVEGERELTGVMAELDHIRGENEQRRDAHMRQMRSVAELGNQCSALESQSAAALATLERSRNRMEELDRLAEDIAAEGDRLVRDRQQLALEAKQRGELLSASKTQLAESGRQQASKQDELATLRQRHSAATERATVLEELQRRQEGLSAGVKEVLAKAMNEPDGPYGEVQGLVADLLPVSVEIAPLIDVALGPLAQHVVVQGGGTLLDQLQQEAGRFAGRVGFIWLDRQSDAPTQPDVNLEGRTGVLGRADRFVEADPRFAALAQRLLCGTWIVEKLSHAIQLASALDHPPSFVTLAGEVLCADGTLVVGPQHAATGLISRRSQLRALQAQLVELDERIEAAEQIVNRLTQQVANQQQQVESRTAEYHEATDALAEQGYKITAAEGRRDQLNRQRTVLESEHDAAVEQHETSTRQLADARARRQQLDAELAEMESRLSSLDEQIGRLEKRRQTHDRATTETKVELAKSEERLRNLHGRLRQFEEGRQERRRAIADSREQLALCMQRADRSQWNILQAESEVAELYLKKETFARQTVELIEQRETLRGQRAELTGEGQKTRSKIRKLEEGIHTQDLAANEVRHERSSLADRLREDYEIELGELEHEPTGEQQQQREEVQEEIDELRRKIGNLGNVNLEALEELDELDSRHKLLSDQYHDLVSAKQSLERIIDRINIDSRRLFTETLETVKGHFQTLFRDLFGGGHADIIMDEETDILESGLEIVARPPGKEPRSISLLSGGEKTITCVALLLAIFRSRPSPFCVLDEVDAALDEANIGRFTAVLNGFLDTTQFIIVTHSKNTMTCANTIYGVTMQESGVSKQVSVRFEDVSDDGHIRPERIAEQQAEEEAQADDTQAA